MNLDLKKKSNEDLAEYCFRLFTYKEANNWTWQDISDIIFENENILLHSEAIRKKVKRFRNSNPDYIIFNSDAPTEEQEATIDNSILERYKLADERNQINAIYRRISREDTIKEIAKDFAQQMGEKLILNPPNSLVKPNIYSKNSGILCISDWHYGLELDNFFNKYDRAIAKKRIEKLQNEVLRICEEKEIRNLTLLNLGDLIGGRIHLQLRLNSRIDVIQQTMEVAELLAEFINNLSSNLTIDYYSTLDNHSRLEPNIKDAIDLESLVRIIDWYLAERLSNNVNVVIHKNNFSDDIIMFDLYGFNVCAVHGHKDKPNKIIDGLSMFTQKHIDLICAAHYHHFSAEEKNETILLSNGSLMGTDDYASNLRLNAKPSQLFVVASPNNVCEEIHKINLD